MMASVLAKLGTRSAFVVHGAGGLDEISTMGTTRVSEVRDGEVVSYFLDPRDYGYDYADHEDLRGGTAEENAVITKRILDGEMGPKREVVLLNTAAALVAAGMAEDIQDGIDKAAVAIDSGAAARKLNQLVEFSQSFVSAEAQVG